MLDLFGEMSYAVVVRKVHDGCEPRRLQTIHSGLAARRPSAGEFTISSVGYPTVWGRGEAVKLGPKHGRFRVNHTKIHPPGNGTGVGFRRFYWT
jgi:hypothetical protein